MDAKKLSQLITKRIEREPNVTYDTLEARAREKHIPDTVFLEAMELVHAFKGIEKRTSGETVKYRSKVTEAKPTPNWLLAWSEWYKAHYPAMTTANSARHEIFAGVDLSYLFMKPDDARRKPVWLKRK